MIYSSKINVIIFIRGPFCLFLTYFVDLCKFVMFIFYKLSNFVQLILFTAGSGTLRDTNPKIFIDNISSTSDRIFSCWQLSQYFLYYKTYFVTVRIRQFQFISKCYFN